MKPTLILMTSMILAATPSRAADPIRPAAPAPRLDPRVRAAWLMLDKLGTGARLLPRVMPQHANGTCPSSIAWVTWGVTKVDPWGQGFRLHCGPHLPGAVAVSSAGPDRRHGTADDLYSHQPPVTPSRVCPAICARLSACASAPGPRRHLPAPGACPAWCQGRSGAEAFKLDTALLAPGCTAILRDMDATLGYETHPAADCRDFAAHVVRVTGKPGTAAKARKGCDEAGLLTRAEQACVAASSTVAEIQSCTFNLPPESWQP